MNRTRLVILTGINTAMQATLAKLNQIDLCIDSKSIESSRLSLVEKSERAYGTKNKIRATVKTRARDGK